MNAPQKAAATAAPQLYNPVPGPVLRIGEDGTVIVKEGTTFGEFDFASDTLVSTEGVELVPGGDYVVIPTGPGAARLMRLDGPPVGDLHIGGFHFAPGGNATARKGGDEAPAINPFSVWDLNYRPACPDPRGMTCVELPGNPKFWVDIYLCAADHLAGTSRLGVKIADGKDRPQKPGGGRYDGLDYDAARAVMAHHGKQLLSLEEFFAAAYGVTERTAIGDDPKVTKLDAPRTSKWGLIQATGNLYVWGHDGDPDKPRASLLGGSWWNDDSAGSRRAYVGAWPGHSSDILGARGRSDHFQPA